MNEKIPLKGVVLDAPDAREFARFYCRLLGWELGDDEADWATAIGPDGSTKLSFQGEPAYQTPTWPSDRGAASRCSCISTSRSTDLETAHRRAIDAGARLMDFQPQPNVRVYADPVGHIFCFFV